jgi:ankyrin repeat protein
MVQLLIDASPDSIDTANNIHGCLFYLTNSNKNLDASIKSDILGLLVERYPEAMLRRLASGYTPLHITLLHLMTVSQNVTLGMVQLLVDADPESIDRVNNSGSTPLHFLCANEKLGNATAVDILGLFFEKCPEAAQHAVGDDDRLPIHLAARYGKSTEFCRMLIEAYPGSERITTSRGLLPFHVACLYGSVSLAEYLYKLYPESINVADRDGRYPIHYAMLGLETRTNRAIAIEMVQLLLDCDPYVLERCPEALRRHTASGYTPLHIMMSANQNVTNGMVQLLVDAYPQSIDRVNNAGNTPLHFLCANKNKEDTAAIDILGLFLERCPEAAQHARGDGRIPIHIAAQGLKSVEFCRMLTEAYPGSERVATSRGALPLHFACRYGTVETAKFLLKLYPESINVADERGSYPIHSAMRGLYTRTNPAIAAEMIQFLLDSDPNVALQKCHGKFPLAVMIKYASNNRNNASKLNAAMTILQGLYDAHPEVIEEDMIASYVDGQELLLPTEIQTFINTQLTFVRQARGRTARQMKKRDENGQVPLHRALRDNFTLGSIKLLVKRNTSVILTPDNSGALPLHVAIQHNDSPEVVDYLIGLDSETLTAVDREGNTALHLACRGAKYDTITLLLEKYGAVSVSQSNVCNKLPIHLLLESNAVSNREDDTKCLESVFQLLMANPETVMLPEDAKQQRQSIPQGGRPSRSGKKRKYCA